MINWLPIFASLHSKRKEIFNFFDRLKSDAAQNGKYIIEHSSSSSIVEDLFFSMWGDEEISSRAAVLGLAT